MWDPLAALAASAREMCTDWGSGLEDRLGAGGFPGATESLGGKDEFLAVGFEGGTDHAFAVAAAVDPGGVEEVDAGVTGALDDRGD